MTICIGAVTANSIIMGCDSLWTWGEDFVREHNSKFVEIPEKYREQILVASAGQDKFTQIFRKLIKKSPDLLGFMCIDGALELVENFQGEVASNGVGDPETNELPEHNMGFLVGSILTRSLWVIESDYNICEFKDYVCAGAGAFLGESSMLSLKKVNITGEEAIRIAIESVSQLHPHCGGKIDIKVLKG